MSNDIQIGTEFADEEEQGVVWCVMAQLLGDLWEAECIAADDDSRLGDQRLVEGDLIRADFPLTTHER